MSGGYREFRSQRIASRGCEFTYGLQLHSLDVYFFPKRLFDQDPGDKRMPASAAHLTFAPVNDGAYKGEAEYSSEI